MGQSWRDLLFAHWRVDPGELEPFVPRGVQLDVRDGAAWLGVTPFEVCGLRPRIGLPHGRGASFLEANVRTYVTRDERPGILFLTLDASSRLAVAAARALYRLPYHRAEMTRAANGFTDYRSARPGVQLQARYAPAGDGWTAAPGTLEWFLVERYCLYTRSAGLVLRADIHHRPWTLHAAAPGSQIAVDLSPSGPTLTGEPLLHVAPMQDVVIWPALPVGTSAGSR